jgi:hypothetical protein
MFLDNCRAKEAFILMEELKLQASESKVLRQIFAAEKNEVIRESITILKNGVFWDVMPCGSCKNRRFGGT